MEFQEGVRVVCLYAGRCVLHLLFVLFVFVHRRVAVMLHDYNSNEKMLRLFFIASNTL